ncbi:OLC1v1000810C1 [Oldenlandia corymbosa var. corymbosa]|uniref:OLC1v1000810C1 n=1 Tax=Oldenlandia corymbosa var. corymbosa TaxID=529605 RepID=A0AAV1D4N7_OLDCO|nr:OLC1v1000810C1 [Oldenlandia corymbosa var. corymbosa]
MIIKTPKTTNIQFNISQCASLISLSFLHLRLLLLLLLHDHSVLISVRKLHITMIPKCFSQPNFSASSESNNSDGSSSSPTQIPQNLVTCVYQTQLCNAQTNLTLTWSKTIFSHTLTIHSPEFFSVTIPLYPSTLSSFFRGTRHGSKSVCFSNTQTQTRLERKLKLYWDFIHAEFNNNSAEPESGFYFAIASGSRMEFYLGDRLDALGRRFRSDISWNLDSGLNHLLSKREHVFGQRSYVTRAQFVGSTHEIGIECGGGALKLKVDGELRLVVKRLAWKFRGNEKIFIGGLEVEFYWDVFNWINNNKTDDTNKKGGNVSGHGVFVFQVGDAGIWPEMVGAEKKLMRKSLSSAASGGRQLATPLSSLPSSPSCSSVLQWADESSECGRSSCSSTRSYGSGGGFSLLLYAWRKG